MRKVHLWIAVAITLAGCNGLGAQTAGGPRLSVGPAYTGKDTNDAQAGPMFPRVDVLVRLTALDGRPAPLKPEDVKLFSDGAEIASGNSVRTFADAGYGVKTILALDMSGSMTGAPLAAIRSTIAGFVNEARDQDRVEVLTFADDTRVEVPFGADRATLTERLKNVKSRGTRTRLYDALVFSIMQLEGAPPACRQLTVITDGHDEGSKHSIGDVIRQAVGSNIQVDSIGLTRSHPEFLEALKHISQATGGSYARANSPQELDGLIDRGIQAMRATPVVAFKADKLAADGKTHHLELRWQPGNLAATVDVDAPLVTNGLAVWIWVLAACFVTGAVLLMVARRQQRTEAAMPFAAPEPAMNRASMVEVEEDKPVTEMPPGRVYVPTVVEGEVAAQPRVRAKTRLAAFFNAEHGAVLEATAGPVAGTSYPVSGELLIGALDGNDVVIGGDPTLSGFHARVRLADSVLTIEDTHSTNGTHVNGVRLGPDRKLLKPNDEIRLGRSVFRVRSQ